VFVTPTYRTKVTLVSPVFSGVAVLRPFQVLSTVARMPTLSVEKKPAAKRPRAGRPVSAAVLPLPAATVAGGPIDAAELCSLGVGVDFSLVKRAMESRRRRAR
jgi:hypothetical protein